MERPFREAFGPREFVEGGLLPRRAGTQIVVRLCRWWSLYLDPTQRTRIGELNTRGLLVTRQEVGR